MKREQIAQAIGLAQQWAPHQVPLLQAAYHGIISVAAPGREMPFPSKILASFGRPSIVLIGDDDGLDTGPGGWTCRSRLPGWARYAVIHASGGEPMHYMTAVMLAREVGRLVLIETGSDNFQAWHDLFARANVRTLNLVVRKGEAHPIPHTSEDLH